MNNEDQPLLNKKAERYGKAIAGFVAASGSPPSWRDCEQTFWAMDKALRAGNVEEFRKLNGKYKIQLAEWEKAADAALAEAENDPDQRPGDSNQKIL